MKLLTELAGDIAFAIDHIDKQERLDYLAYYDALTGLANRSLFLERVAQYMRSAASGGHKLAAVPDRSGAVQEHQRQPRPAGRRRAPAAGGGVADAQRGGRQPAGAGGCGPFCRGAAGGEAGRRRGAASREDRWQRFWSIRSA